ncbi:hypothetical protein T492DRAFT_876898, partial [Pavlovales sp. CCMP2436]
MAEPSAKHILVTGGAGYIGSHTVVEPLNAGFRVTVVDNPCNSSEESLNRVTRPEIGPTLGHHRRGCGPEEGVRVVEDALGHGLSLVAVRDYESGEVLLDEPPRFLLVEETDGVDAELLEAVCAATERAPTD